MLLQNKIAVIGCAMPSQKSPPCFSTELSRRAFVTRMLAGSAMALLPAASRAAELATTPVTTREHDAKRLKILVLGGTRYVGPAIVRESLGRNHEVTLFNRGKSQPELFRGLERLRGNRFPEIKPGLAALEGTRTWDVVIDIPAYYPRLVEATARLLAPRAAHYVVMSSISAYADFKTVGLHEESPVRPVAESFEEKEDLTMGDWPTYGGRKAACERTASRVFDGRFAAVRACSIIGGTTDADDTTRYWPARIARGGRILAPGDGTDGFQAVDVGDVAKLILTIAERRWRGVFNAVAPGEPATFRDYLEACIQAVGSRPEIRWLSAKEMERFGVTRAQTPQWAPSAQVPGFARISSAKARKRGWTTQPLVASVAANWLYFRENFSPDYDFQATETGLSPRREQEILAALG